MVAAAASSVGRLMIADAREQGLEVIAVVRNGASAAQLTALFPGLAVVRTQSEHWRQQLDGLVGSRPVHIAIDAHGGPFTRDLLTVIAPGGTVLIFGDLSKTGAGIEAFDFVRLEVGIRGLSIERWFERGPGIQDSDRKAALRYATSWPHLFDSASTFALEDIKEAVSAAQSRGKRGTPLLQLGEATPHAGGISV